MVEQFSGAFLQCLRAFYYVAARGGVTQAARAVGQAQPTITLQIQRLERELGVTLFDRSSRQMQLTPEGRVLFERAISLFESLKEIKAESRPAEFQGRIIIASTHGISTTFLPEYIAKFRSTHPLVAFDTLGEGYDAVVERVKSAVVDFGISYYDSAIPDSVSCYKLFERGTVLVTTKDSKLFNGKSPTLKEVARTPLVLLSRAGSMEIEPLVVKRFEQANLQPHVVLTNNNPVTVKQYVSFGIGAALVNELSITKEDHQIFNIYSMDRYFPKRKYGLLLRKGKYLAPHVKAFICSIKPDIQFKP